MEVKVLLESMFRRNNIEHTVLSPHKDDMPITSTVARRAEGHYTDSHLIHSSRNNDEWLFSKSFRSFMCIVNSNLNAFPQMHVSIPRPK